MSRHQGDAGALSQTQRPFQKILHGPLLPSAHPDGSHNHVDIVLQVAVQLGLRLQRHYFAIHPDL